MHTPSMLVSVLALAPAALAIPAVRRQNGFPAGGFPGDTVPTKPNCTQVQVFVGRGSLEEIPGRQGKLVDAICAKVPGQTCGSTNIQYPATFDLYCKSVGVGIANALYAVESYAAACPDSKIVLTGYSQGAHLVGDILSGTGGVVPNQNCTLATTQPLASQAASKVAAVTLFGDVRHTASQPYNTGEGAPRSGILPRTGAQLKGLNTYSTKIKSWCNAQDPVCSSGNDISQHLTYFDQFTDDAATFVKTKL